MRRREFITLLGAAAAWPVAARGQQTGRLPKIGFLGQSTPSVESERLAAFQKRLRALGWIEGRTVIVEYQWGEGSNERFARIAADFVRLEVDVIVTSGTATVIAAKQATSAIPIVFAVAGDPIANNLVAGLARPGGNVTGLSTVATDLVGKRVELLREAVPEIRRLAILGNAANSLSLLEMSEVRTAANTVGLAADPLAVRGPEEITSVLQGLKGPATALYVVADPFTNTNRTRIHTLAMAAKLPSIYNAKEHVVAGGLMSYGPNFPDLYSRAAEFVDRILRGAKPGDIPVEQPIRSDLVLNMNTAKALSLSIPPTVLARADEVIE